MTGHVQDGAITLDVTTFQAAPGRAQVVALGAPHPDLFPLGYRHHADYDDLAMAAALTRMQRPAPPVDLGEESPERQLAAALRRAVAA